MIRQRINQDQLHSQNLKLVLQQIFNNQPTSRIEISHNLKLNKSTVSSLYRTLMEAGYLTELGLGEASTAGGRKPVLVGINGQYGYTMTFDLGYRHLHLIANDLNGGILRFDRINVKNRSIHEMIDLIKAFISNVQAADKTDHGLLGICFSIHGIVLNNEIRTSPWTDMDGVDLYKEFSNKYDVPVILENEANLSAIYERDFNGARDLDNMIAISIHRGIGAGVIMRKELFRGKNGEAGEIGRMMANVTSYPEGHSRPQHVEDICSEDAIIARVEERKGLENLTREDLVRMYQKNDKDVIGIFMQFAVTIAELIHNVVSTLDPDAVFLNSPLIEEVPDLLKEIRKIYSKISLTEMPISVTSNARLATVLGGCSLITHHVLGLEEFEMNFKPIVGLAEGLIK